MMPCLHDYKTLRESSHGWSERCAKCGHRNLVQRGLAGSFDDKKFLSEHRRDFLQSQWEVTAKEYEREYGKTDPQSHYQTRKKTPEQLRDELIEEAHRELRKTPHA